MSKTTKIHEISNHYGTLEIVEERGKYYWGLSDYDINHYNEISKSLYDELKNHLILKKLKS